MILEFLEKKTYFWLKKKSCSKLLLLLTSQNNTYLDEKCDNHIKSKFTSNLKYTGGNNFKKGKNQAYFDSSNKNLLFCCLLDKSRGFTMNGKEVTGL